jgi:NAD(P)-dependent dehydrogenase (short-subunit alcohol dehydrogenase family)
MNSPDLKPDRVRSVVVTGGSSGIGAELCRAAAGRGWHVWIGYLSGAERAQRLADEIAALRGLAAVVRLPLDDPGQLRASVESIAAHGPEPEALVLCGAPAPDVMPLIKLTPEHFRRQYECAVIGGHVLLAEMWRRCFRARGGGHVAAVLSAALGPVAAPHMASYVAAKGGLDALLRAAAAELGPAGLRVSTISPGYVETPMLRAFSPLLLDRARAQQPDKQFLAPRDVALALLQGLEHPPAPGTVHELPREMRLAS